MKRIKMEFYIDECNEKYSLNRVLNNIINSCCTQDLIKYEFDDVNPDTLIGEKYDNLIVVKYPEFYSPSDVPRFASFNKDNGYMSIGDGSIMHGIKLFNLSNDDENKKFKESIKGKSSGMAFFDVYKIIDMDDIYYLKDRIEIDEEIFINSPYNSFVDLYTKKYFDKLTDENFEMVKDLFKKAAKNQQNMEMLLMFLRYADDNVNNKNCLDFESKHMEELVKILVEKEISIQSIIKALYGKNNYFNRNYSITNFDYYVFQYLYNIEPKYIDIIIDHTLNKVEPRFNFSYYYSREETMTEIIKYEDLDLLLSSIFYMVVTSNLRLWCCKSEAITDKCGISVESLKYLKEFCTKVGCELTYDELKNEIINTYSKLLVCDTDIINKLNGSLLFSSMLFTTRFINNTKIEKLKFDKPLIADIIFYALENLKGRNREIVRASILKNIIDADKNSDSEHSFVGVLNKFIKENNYDVLQKSLLKVRLKK